MQAPDEAQGSSFQISAAASPGDGLGRGSATDSGSKVQWARSGCSRMRLASCRVFTWISEDGRKHFCLLGGGGGAVIFPTPLLNGCLVSHLLYQTFMPFQKWGFSCVGLVVVVSFSVVCKISFEYICPYLSNSTPEGECLSIRGTSFFGRPCLDGQKGCFPQPS